MPAILEQPQTSTEKPKIVRYGVPFHDTPQTRKIFSSVLLTELFFFRECIRHKDSKNYTQEGRAYHGRKIAEMIWPHIIWTHWMEEMWDAFCSGTKEVLLTGPGSAGKTLTAALYCLVWWMCDPMHSGVLLGSTTMRGLRQRIWSEVRKLFQMIPEKNRNENGWNMVENPTPGIQLSRGNLKYGIFCVATDGGEDKRIGYHPERLLVIADELTGVPWNLIEDLTNLFTGKQEEQFIGLGNASSIFDSHGKMCEPADGWNSVDVNSSLWKTKRDGICLHIDGFKSPNVIEGREVYPFLITQNDINKTAKDYGENSPQMWRMRRGFWCPEGVVKSILSSSLIQKMRAMETAEWRGGIVFIAMLDPAFEGGDRRILRFAKCGESNERGFFIEYGDIIHIKVDLKESKEPIHYQIAHSVINECRGRGIDIENFAMDTTGEGGGLSSIIKEEWGTGFLEVEFGGKPSDDPVGVNDPRACSDVYKNKVTELWYSFREAVMFGQVRGMDAETCIEFCNRLYMVKDKIVVEPKSEMKERPFGRSPDLADAAVIGLHLARKRGYLGYVQSKALHSVANHWTNMYREMQLEEANFSGDGINDL